MAQPQDRQFDRPSGSRLDRVLAARYPLLTRRHVEEAIAAGLVTDGRGGRLKKGARLDDETMSALRSEALDDLLTELARGTAGIPVPIVSETDDFVLIDKPAGLPSHPISLFDRHTVTHWALDRYPDLAKEFPACQPAVTPHRLDHGTSGAQLVAKNRSAFDLWRGRFARHEIEKSYLAWCWGEACERDIRYPLAHDPADARRIVALADEPVRHRPPVMEAASRIEPIRRDGDLTLVRVVTRTGATHQVRVHLAAAGWPLVGDRLYDPFFETRAFQPRHPHLRCEEIRWENLRLPVPSAAFINSVYSHSDEDFRGNPQAPDSPFGSGERPRSARPQVGDVAHSANGADARQ